MTESQPDYQPRRSAGRPPAVPPQWQQGTPSRQDGTRPTQPQYPAPQRPRYQQRQPERREPSRQPAPVVQAVRKTALTAAESFWYVLGCIAFGGMYFAKIPPKKALADFGMAELTTAESFWYVLMCIGFGAGYFAKLPVVKALSEMQPQGGYR